MSLKDGAAYNKSLMPLCRGDVLPDRAVPVQWMMYDLWEAMRKCDKELADEVLEPVFMFMRAQTSSERLSIQGLGRYLEYRQGDVGQAYAYHTPSTARLNIMPANHMGFQTPGCSDALLDGSSPLGRRLRLSHRG